MLSVSEIFNQGTAFLGFGLKKAAEFVDPCRPSDFTCHYLSFLPKLEDVLPSLVLDALDFPANHPYLTLFTFVAGTYLYHHPEVIRDRFNHRPKYHYA